MSVTYHVAKNGNDLDSGSQDKPFATIQRAASAAAAGDTVIVHEGEYREWVKPENGGLSEHNRIVYRVANGEKVVIKGSERITDWKNIEGTVWKTVLPNSFFGAYNPYLQKIEGDWLVAPLNHKVHSGEVYLNGKSCYEAFSFDEVKDPKKRFFSCYETWGNRKEAILEPDQTLYQWYCEVDEENTTIYANFQGVDPNKEMTEINVRRSCFYPEKTGLDYITVDGFEMAQAATTWAPPTDDQPGLIGPHWAKGWIIENCTIHDSKCSGISLGKDAATGNGECTKYHRKPGYQYQMEDVFRALHIGWSRERIGSHIIRNNKIYDCGQNAVVGHLGCIFSQITGNEIYNIAVKHEFYGHEIAGIKLHAAIDVQICNNYIHDCTLGTWLDWQAQNVRVSSNIYAQNNRDFFIEVTHGPYLVDQNIFASAYNFDNAAQGGSYVHNLCAGFLNHYPVLNRSTPYHLPHSTEIKGCALVYGNDDRWYQNVFVGGNEKDKKYGTADYNGAPTSLEEYISRVLARGEGDVELYEQEKQPAYINMNVYLNGSQAFDREQQYCTDLEKSAFELYEKEDGLYLKIKLPEKMFQMDTQMITSKLLGMTRISEMVPEQPDGSSYELDTDFFGEKREKKPVCGPFEKVHSGYNDIKIWQRR